MPLKKHEADKLIDVIRGFVDETKPATVERNGIPGPGKMAAPEDRARIVEAGDGKGPMFVPPFDEEALYQRFRARIIDDAQIDPVLLKLLMVQPEMIVEYERRVETFDGTNLRGRVAKLIATGYFDEGKPAGAVRRELARVGADPGGGGSLYDQLGALQKAGFLTKEGDNWKRAPGIKIREKELETKL